MATQQDQNQASTVNPLEAYRSHEQGAAIEVLHGRVAAIQGGFENLGTAIIEGFGAKPELPTELQPQPTEVTPVETVPVTTEPNPRTVSSADPATNYNNVVDIEARRAQAQPETPEHNLDSVRASINAAFDEAA